MKKIFISYSHEDFIWKDRLLQHLSVLRRQGKLSVWSDSEMEAGDRMKKEIFQEIDNSDLIILLVSSAFLSSNFITKEELPRFFDKQKKDNIKIIPFILKDCDWKGDDVLASLLARPKDGTPLISLAEEYRIEEALSDFAKEIREIVTNETPIESYEEEETDNKFISRGESLKQILDTFYSEAIQSLSEEFADKKNPSYSDVPPSHYSFNYVEIASGLSILNRKENFDPDSLITKAEAIKFLILSADIPFLTTINHSCFLDIKDHSDRDFIISAFNNNIIFKEGNNFYPDQPLEKDIFFTWIKEAEIRTGGVKKGTFIGKNSSVEISLSPDTPKNSSIPSAASTVPFIAIELHNTTTKNILLKSIILAHGGLGVVENLPLVKLYNGLQKISEATFSLPEEIALLNINSPLLLKPGEITTIVATIDIDTSVESSGHEHTLSLLSPDDVSLEIEDSLEGPHIEGHFPIEGKTQKIVNLDTGSLDVKLISSEIKNNNEPDLICITKINSRKEDTIIQSIAFTTKNIPDGFLKNMYVVLKKDDKYIKVSEIEPCLKNNFVSFEFSRREVLVEENSEEKLFLLANVDSRIRAIIPKLIEVSDIVSVGLTYGFSPKVNIHKSIV